MIGGIITDVADIGGNLIYVDCVCRHTLDFAAIHVVANDDAKQIRFGDLIWWQSDLALWTPIGKRGAYTGHRDVKLKRKGPSGVRSPLADRVDL